MNKSSSAGKADIRQKMLHLRKTVSPGENEKKSGDIACRVTSLDIFRSAETLLIYRAMSAEVQTGQIIEIARQAGKRVCVPLIVEGQNNLQAVEWPKETNGWTSGPFGIPQPLVESALQVPVNQLDLVLAPGLAFDNRGGRLGYGKGYFDRLFDSTRTDCFRLGLAFDFQVIEKVPMSPDDQALNGIVTETRTILCAS